MVDDKELSELVEGTPDPRLNGMTPEQFRALVTAAEAYLTMMLQGNAGMLATMLVELQCRMILDMDEVDAAMGSKMLEQFHGGLDKTISMWRLWAAEAARERARVANKGLN